MRIDDCNLLRAGLISIALTAILISQGCSVSRPLEVKLSSSRRSSTQPLGKIKTEGIYVCRGLKVIGSEGGFGIWALRSAATQIELVEYLKFDEDGTVSVWNTKEPSSIDDATHFFRIQENAVWKSSGKVLATDSVVRFTIRALNAGGHDYAETPYQGVVYEEYLALTKDNGEYFPSDSRYNYREYDFVSVPK